MAAVLPSSAHAPLSSVASTSTLPAASTLHASSNPPSFAAPPPSASVPADSSSSSSSDKKVHACPHCPKTYSKRSKLTAHVGTAHPPGGTPPARPFPCPFPGCTESFGRRDHLDVHARVHRPESDRPYVCGKAGCEKRFWTSQHKRRHEDGCGVSGGSHQVRLSLPSHGPREACSVC